MVIWHSRTGASEAMARAAAHHESAVLVGAQDVEPTMLLDAAGFIFACPENLGSMSGAMKEMFDATYYDVLGKIDGKPYGTIIAAGSDGSGAVRQLDRIVTGWRLKRVVDSLIVNFDAQTPGAIWAQKKVPNNILKQCTEMGHALAEGLKLGIF